MGQDVPEIFRTGKRDNHLVETVVPLEVPVAQVAEGLPSWSLLDVAPVEVEALFGDCGRGSSGQGCWRFAVDFFSGRYQ